jgi:acyl carrier protein
LEYHFDVSLPVEEFDQFDTVEDLSSRIENSLGVKSQVLQLVAKQARVPKANLRHGTSLVGDLSIDRLQLARLRRDLGRQLRMHVDWEEFKQFETVGEVVNYAGELAARRKQAEQEKKTRP